MAKNKRKDYVIRRTDDWQAWQQREDRLFKGFPVKIKRYQERVAIAGKNLRRSSAVLNRLMISIDANIEYHRILEANVGVPGLDCPECAQRQPFYDFYFSASCTRGREAVCRKCIAGKNKQKFNPQAAKLKRQENYEGRLRIQVATSVKRHIAKVTGEYCESSVGSIWLQIEESCGYNHIELAAVIETQFASNMHWGNQITPKKGGSFGWHLDHIIPHHYFKYDSLSHPDFADCWALKNLRPYGAVKNMQKGNRILYTSLSNSFRRGIHKAIAGELYTDGVWKHLDYDNLEAKKILEEKFAAAGGMNWSNWGKFWQIDHIIPKAKLAYVNPAGENFKKCWSLVNLQPLRRSTNAAKGSRHDGCKWFHNY